MKIRILPLLICIGFFINSQAQSYTLKGVVLDQKTNESLIAVNIYNQSETVGTFSDIDGSFEINITRWPATLIFSYLGYDNYSLTLNEAPTQALEIKMQTNALRLPDIEVIAEPIVEKITPPEFSIRDFLIQDDLMLVIKYGGIIYGNYLELLTLDGTVLHAIKIDVKGAIDRLHQSCLGNIHLLGNREIIEVAIDKQQIVLINKYPRAQFEKYILPCVESSQDYIYTKKEQALGQRVLFSIISKKEGTLDRRIYVNDVEDLLRMREEFAMRSSMDGYFSAATANPQNPQNALSRPEHYDGWQTMFYQPIYSPLYNTGSELCLFNHTLGFLRFYTYAGELKYQFPINYHREKNWDSQVLRDLKTNKFYTVYKDKKGRKFYEVNLANGALRPSFKIETNFLEKMIIYDGFLFYMDSGVISSEVNRRIHKVKVD